MTIDAAEAHDLDLSDELPPGEDGGDDIGPTVEERARLRGWKPLEEYRGPPEHWRSAEEFLRVGEQDSRVLREENRRLEGKVHRLGNEITELKNSAAEQLAALREMRVIAARNDQRGYDRAMAELTTQRRAAVDAGDQTAFDQVEEQIKTLGARPADPPPPSPPPPPPAAAIDPDVQTFIEDNPWYTSDADLNRTMMQHYDIVARRNPRWTVVQNLDEAKARTIADYPERFNDMPPERRQEPPPLAPRRQATTVGRPSGIAPRSGRSPSGWDQIGDQQERQEARASYERQRRADPDLTEGEFLQIYLDPHIDVLALRQQRKKA